MRVVIAGDFAPRARLAKQIEEERFSEIFSEDLCQLLKTADFSFVNFESPVVKDKYKPIIKCGPHLKSTSKAVEAVKFAGFTGVTLSNNHILDYGEEGLLNSVETFTRNGLDTVGVGCNVDDAGKVLYLEKDGSRLAVINCCEHEFSIASDKTAGANPLHPVRQFYAIQEAKHNADHVLVIVHGGHEYFQLPSPRMVETYRFFIDAGADAVVNHHQHCYSGFETYKGKPICYGLGNFGFDWEGKEPDSLWNYGYMLEIVFEEPINTVVFPYCQYADEATIKMLEQNAFDEHLKHLNSIICDKKRLNQAIEAYYAQESPKELALFEPYRGRVLRKLYRLGLLPTLFKGRNKQAVLNHIMCEAHRDKLEYALTRKEIKAQKKQTSAFK